MRRGKKKGKSASYCMPFPIRLLLKAFNTERKRCWESFGMVTVKERSFGEIEISLSYFDQFLNSRSIFGMLVILIMLATLFNSLNLLVNNYHAQI